MIYVETHTRQNQEKKLKIIYQSIFNSHLIYACEILEQNQTMCYFKKLLYFQEKAFRIIAFRPQTLPSDCVFKENEILKISDILS